MLSPVFMAVVVVALFPKANAGIQVIGSGYGRTGTETLREALNSFGYKTYHMKVILEGQLSEHHHVWETAAESNCANIDDIKSLFEEGGYTAAVDFPACMCWEALMNAYPEAKVIHTERSSAEEWYESASNTILLAHKEFPLSLLFKVAPFFISMKKMWNAMWSSTLGKNVSIDDDSFPEKYREDFMAVYAANNERVKKVVPRNRLLIQNHADGWKELCPFLGKDVPSYSYPHSNKREDTKAFLRNLGFMFFGAMMVIGTSLMYMVKWVLKNLECRTYKLKSV